MATKAAETMSKETALRNVQEVLVNRLRGKPIRIYEAGGGSISVIPLSLLDHPTVTAVDIDEAQVRNNKYADVKILGDIQTHAFPLNSFDLIVCYNVIEHLSSVDQAIKQFYRALAPGGLLFIGAPNPDSLYGLVTKYTPHWFHGWVYRVILRSKNAGKPGQGPFRTIYHPLVSPKALSEFCSQLGFEVIYLNQYDGGTYTEIKEKSPIIGAMLNATVNLMNVLTFGRRNFSNGDYHVVVEKRAASANL
jgi:SAM-dependent methyltransferase